MVLSGFTQKKNMIWGGVFSSLFISPNAEPLGHAAKERKYEHRQQKKVTQSIKHRRWEEYSGLVGCWVYPFLGESGLSFQGIVPPKFFLLPFRLLYIKYLPGELMLSFHLPQ